MSQILRFEFKSNQIKLNKTEINQLSKLSQVGSNPTLDMTTWSQSNKFWIQIPSKNYPEYEVLTSWSQNCFFFLIFLHFPPQHRIQTHHESTLKNHWESSKLFKINSRKMLSYKILIVCGQWMGRFRRRKMLLKKHMCQMISRKNCLWSQNINISRSMEPETKTKFLQTCRSPYWYCPPSFSLSHWNMAIGLVGTSSLLKKQLSFPFLKIDSCVIIRLCMFK